MKGSEVVPTIQGPGYVGATVSENAPMLGAWLTSFPGTGDTQWANAAAAGVSIWVPSGAYTLTASHTFTAPVSFAYGALITLSSGQTITFQAGIVAPTAQIFAGAGLFAFGPAQLVGHPEWWGAWPNNGTVDSSAAINACIVACPVTQLLQANYYIANSIVVAINGKTLRGVGWEQNEASNDFSTQIVIGSASVTGIIVGTNQLTEPGTFISNVTLEDFTLLRTVGPANPSTGSLSAESGVVAANWPMGVKVMWSSLFRATRVFSGESSIGFYIYGGVESWLENCSSLRTLAGTVPANDQWSGFFLDYSAPASGFNGGNASIYLNKCRAFLYGGAGVYSAGLTTNQGFVDLYVNQLETGATQYGMDFWGGFYETGPYTDEDLIVAGCVSDQCTVAGLSIRGTNSYCAVTVTGCYFNALAGGYGISLNSCNGAITISGCQFFSSIAAAGIYAYSSVGIHSRGNIFNDMKQSILFATVESFSLEDNIHKISLPGTAVPAISLTGCQFGYVRPIIAGPGTSYSCGISIDNTSSRIEVNCTTIQPPTVGSGAGDKIHYNGAAWGGGGTFGTNNIATGVLD
jgi:hypothetical protein